MSFLPKEEVIKSEEITLHESGSDHVFHLKDGTVITAYLSSVGSAGHYYQVSEIKSSDSEWHTKNREAAETTIGRKAYVRVQWKPAGQANTLELIKNTWD